LGPFSARVGLAVLALALAVPCAAETGARVEAKSQDLLAVGIVEAERMHIHVSRLVDNAPVRDASVAVTLRGETHSTVAEADGSYTLTDKDLSLPGSTALEFQITEGTVHEILRGNLQVGGTPKPEGEKSQARQYWWWALNFGVCIGFLMLLSRRKKKSDEE
jgi:hypothetical protein